MRVYELAREVGVPSRDLLTLLDDLGFAGARTASSSVPDGAAARLRLSVVRTPPMPEIVLEAADLEALDPVPIAAVADGDAPPERPTLEELPGREPGAARLLARWAAMATLWIVLGSGAGLVLAVTVPYVFGFRSFTVLSGSMEPAVNTGDVVVVQEIEPLDARVGDIVSFRDPEDATRLITHRVRRMDVNGDVVEFVTKGDANTSVEQWRVTTDGTIGRVGYRVQRIGYLLFWVRGRFGRLLLVVVPALLLGAYELWRIWRPQPQDQDAVTAGAGS